MELHVPPADHRFGLAGLAFEALRLALVFFQLLVQKFGAGPLLLVALILPGFLPFPNRDFILCLKDLGFVARIFLGNLFTRFVDLAGIPYCRPRFQNPR